MNFTELNLDTRLIKALNMQEIYNPLEIQKTAIPSILKRENIIGIAPTGSGKTLAFLLPSLHWLINAKITHTDPSILIIVPTRELVKQIYDEITSISKFSDISVAQIYSGPRETKQLRTLDNNVIDIVVATPGRLNNFLTEGRINLANISVLILDEVDRLLDMGFQTDIEKTLAYLPHKNKRQTLLFCSTLPKPVEAIAKSIQSKSKIIDIGRSQAPNQIKHEVYEVYEDEKFDILIEILHRQDIESALIFTQSQKITRITSRNLLKKGLEIEEFHGGLTQQQRMKALSNFKNQEVNVLIATDIAARGLDIKELTHVISFDVPNDFDDYLHRAGRTGRAFNSGTSILIVSPKEDKNLTNIENKLGLKIDRIRERKKKVVKKFESYKKQTKSKNLRFKKF